MTIQEHHEIELEILVGPLLILRRTASYGREITGDIQKQFDLEEASPGDDAKRIPLRTQLRRAAAGCLKPCSSPSHVLSTLLSFVPIVQWLPLYNFRECIVADLIGGITTGIMHVPAGLAYSVLAGVDPVYGLYSSCFPAFFYMLFGTSKHCSIGSFAVVTLMAGIANDHIMHQHGTAGLTTENNGTLADPLTPIQIASTLTFAIGIVQFASGLFRLEFIVSYFSDPLVSGFTTGSAVHVFLAQIDDIFGVTGLPKSSGPGYAFVRAQDIIIAMCDRTNFVALLTSIVIVPILWQGVLVAIILSTAVSAMFGFQHEYYVPVVGFIPTGPPTPSLPVVRPPHPSRLPLAVTRNGGMAKRQQVVVSIAVHISLAKIYAKKLNYTVDARQELYALGASSMLGGLFSVYPVSTALGRTACILACVIIVALRGMFQRSDELGQLWRVSRTDLLIWIVSFTATVVIDVMEGLAISILFALATVIFRSQWPKWESFFGATTGENEDGVLEGTSVPRPSVCIFRFDAPLIFTNVERFVNKVKKTIDEWEENCLEPFAKYFIIDCSSIAYIDYMGVKALSESVIDLKKRGITVYLAAVKPDVHIALKTQQGLFNDFLKEQIFPTLRDALIHTDEKC